MLEIPSRYPSEEVRGEVRFTYLELEGENIVGDTSEKSARI